MSFGVTSLGSLGDTAARSTYTCALSRAPNAGTLVLIGVNVTDTAGTPAEPSSVSGAGLVFSLVTSSLTYDPISVGSQLHNFSAWRGMGSAPDSSMISVAFANNQNGCAILVHEVSGVSTSGTSGANAIGKSANSVTDQISTLTIFAPSATSTANAWLAFCGTASSSNQSFGQNYTPIDGVTFTTPFTGLWSAWTTLSTGTTVSISSNIAERAGVLIELVLDNPGGGGGGGSASTTTGKLGRRVRIPPVPMQIRNSPVGQYLELVVRQLNAEGWISLFSGTDPNTSNFTGVPGSLALNIGSASTVTRLWIQGGSVASASTLSWHPFRVA